MIMDENVFNGENVNENDDYQDIFNKIKTTRSCIKCNFRYNRLMSRIFNELNNITGGWYENWNFEGSIFPIFIRQGFKNCNLKKTSFKNSFDFRSRGFHDCDLTGADLGDVAIQDAGIINCTCVGMNFNNGSLIFDSSLRGSILTDADFSNSRFDSVDLYRCNLTRTKFNGATFLKTVFFTNSIIYNNTDFSNTYFGEIIIYPAILFNLSTFANANIETMTFKKSFLHNVNLYNTSIGKIKGNILSVVYNSIYFHLSRSYNKYTKKN